MRLKSICTDEIIHQISIHAPLTGCDDTQLKEVTNTADISIHAPLTGCDLLLIPFFLYEHYFNPRTPYGMRLKNI